MTARAALSSTDLSVAAQHRRVLDRRVHHAVDLGIHPEHGLAADDVGEVVGGLIFANVAPRAARLELQRLARRHGQLRGGRDERRISRAPSGRPVDDLVRLGLTLADGHLPLGRRRLHEHHARRRAGLAERVEEVSNRFRAVGVLIAVTRIANPLFDLDPRPVGVELVGGDHRQRRPDAGAHLGAVRHDVDGAVRIDAKVDTWMERRGVGLRAERCHGLRVERPRHEARDDHQGAGREDAFQEVPAAEVRRRDRRRNCRGSHGRPSATLLIAARMR